MQKHDSGFSSAERLEIAYTDKPVSGWGGLVAVMRFFEKIGVREALLRALPDGRTSPNQIPVVDIVLAFLMTVLSCTMRSRCACHRLSSRPPIVLQLFDDDEKRRRAGTERKELTRVLCGPLPQVWATVEALNKQGAGVFIQVNGGARGTKNVTALRALFIDDDGGQKARQPDGTYILNPTPKPKIKLSTSAVIERGGNDRRRHYYYWFLKEGEPLEKFTD